MGRRRSVYLSDDDDRRMAALQITLPAVIQEGLDSLERLRDWDERKLPPAGTSDTAGPAGSPGKGRKSRPSPEDCPHPRARVHKGLCGACGTHVGER
jgi:hypothetical protein